MSFFHLWEQIISEMPMTHGGSQFYSDNPEDYEKAMGVTPNDSHRGTKFYYSPINRRDRAAITKPDYWNAVGQTLDRVPEGWHTETNSGGYNWNVIILELDPNRSNFRQYQEMTKEYMQKHGLHVEGHITFVKNRSSGDGVSRWILFHNAGHAVFERQMESVNAPHKTRIKNIFNEIYLSHAKSYGQEPMGNRFHIMQVVSRYFPHKSGENAHAWRQVENPARAKAVAKKGISSINEMIYDLFAQYIVTGNVKLTNDAKFAKTDLKGGHTVHQTGAYLAPDLGSSKIEEDFLTQKSLEIRAEIISALKNCVGQIIYHYRPLYGSTTPIPDHRIRPGSPKMAKKDPRDYAAPFQKSYTITPDYDVDNEDDDTGAADWLKNSGNPTPDK